MHLDNLESWRKKLKELGNDIEELQKLAETGSTEEDFEHARSNTRVAIYKVRDLLVPWKILLGLPVTVKHQITPEEIAKLKVTVEDDDCIRTFSGVCERYGSYSEEYSHVEKIASILDGSKAVDPDQENKEMGKVVAQGLLESLDQAGYAIVKKER